LSVGEQTVESFTGKVDSAIAVTNQSLLPCEVNLDNRQVVAEEDVSAGARFTQVGK